MDPYTFDNLVSSLKRNKFPDTQVHMIEITIGAAGWISTSQVAHLLRFLSSDDDKLQVAKMAYGYVVNQASYGSIVGEAFSSNTTEAALDAYIARHW
jgi:hypothetical protein